MDIIDLLFLIVGLIYGLLLFTRPRIATYILIFLCIFQFGWFTRYFGASDYLGRMLYFLAMLLGGRIVIDFVFRRIEINKDDKITQRIIVFMLGLFVLNICSNIYNQESIILGIYELRYYFVMVVLYFSIYYYTVHNLKQEVFIKYLVMIGFLQIPFAVIQFVLAGGGIYRTLDSVTGTFSSYGPLVFCTILNIGLLLNHKLVTGKNLFKSNSYFLIFVLILPLLLSKSRVGTGLVLFMIMFVFMWAFMQKSTKVDFVKGIVLMTAVFLITTALFYNFFWKRSYDLSTQFSIDYVISYFMRGPQALETGMTAEMGRARAVYEASILIKKNFVTLIIGCGGGSVSKANLLDVRGRFFDFGPYVGIGRTQVSKILAENGVFGIFIFIFLFYSIMQRIKQIKSKDALLWSNYIILLISILLLSLYMAVFQSPLAALILASFFVFVQIAMKKLEK